MRQLITKFIVTIIFVSLIIACEQSDSKVRSTTKAEVLNPTGELIKIDFKDTNYIDLQMYAIDTTTSDGWAIKYFVKDDSTKYKDIYIQCSKGKLKGIFDGIDLLMFRRYFVPVFVGESDSFIYLEHGCATDCSALLVFSKEDPSRFEDFKRVVDYNINYNQVLYVTDSSYEIEDSIYDLALSDLAKDSTHKITYNNICDFVYKPSCIDTVIFNKKQLTIKTTLRKNIDTDEEISQTKIIKL